MKKKTLKGMTLMEVIIAIAVFAVFGVILVTAGTTIDNLTKATTNLKKKVTMQSPYAANHLHSYVDQNGDPQELIGTPLADDIQIKGYSSPADKDSYKLKGKDDTFVTEGNVYTYSFTRNSATWTAKVTFDSTSKLTCEVYDENGNFIMKKSFSMNDADWRSKPFYADNAKVYVSDVVALGTLSTVGTGNTIEFKNIYADGVVEGKKYSTQEIYDDKMQGKTSPYNNGLNLQYIEIGNNEPPTEPTT